jgi:hypothetical protein
MDSLIGWFAWAGIGILSGLFPAWWFCSALIMQNYKFNQQPTPKLLLDIARNNPGFGVFQIIFDKTTYYPSILRISAIVWIILFLTGYHFLALTDYAKDNFMQIIAIETSFPILILVTWLLPSWFMKRYLKRLAKRTL